MCKQRYDPEMLQEEELTHQVIKIFPFGSFLVYSCVDGILSPTKSSNSFVQILGVTPV